MQHPAAAPEVLEESPSTRVTQEMRTDIGKNWSNRSLNRYVNAGTVEFLMDEDGSLTS